MANTTSCCAVGSPAPDGYVPTGKVTNLSMNAYISSPEGVQPVRGTLLLLPDGFGLARHNLMLADAFAQTGWRVIVPDLFEGDPLPIAVLRSGMKLVTIGDPLDTTGNSFNVAAWLQRHNHARVSKLLDKLLVHIRSEPVQGILVGIGYCFGGKHAFQLAKKGLKVAVAFHPSYVEKEDVQGLQIPFFVGLAAKDTWVPVSLAESLHCWVGPGTDKNGHLEIEIFPGVGHGFAARPDTQDRVVFEQHQIAMARATAFLDKYST